MPSDHVYVAIVVVIVLTTVIPAFVVARFAGPSLGPLFGSLAGFGCGVLVLVAEAHLINRIKWNDIFFVLLLPGLGVSVASIWPARSAQGAGWRRRFAAIALLFLAAAFVCGMLYLQDESASAPFAAGTKGAVAEVQLRVPPTEHSYACWLKLSYPEGDHGERERIKQLVGSGARDREGRSVDTGLAIPVRLVVERIDRDGSSSVLDSVFTNHKPWASGFGSYSKMITRVRLAPGRYRARIEALENIRELEGVPVAFGIGIPGNEK